MRFEEDQLQEMRQTVINWTGKDPGTKWSTPPDWMDRIDLRVQYSRLYRLLWMAVKE